MTTIRLLTFLGCCAFSMTFAPNSHAKNGCSALPTHQALRAALVEARNKSNGGLGFHMWASIVDRDGIVCAVAMTGAARDDQWPGSRLISAQKANTANAFSLPQFALSTANLFSAVQPGGSLFGLQESNPINSALAYSGDAAAFGSVKDPIVGSRIGGVNVFGGGLALYAANGGVIGAVGVSGDTSCADHNIAWRVRQTLSLDYVPGGVNNKADGIIYDINQGKSASGYGHPECSPESRTIAETLPRPRSKQ
jgi:uncharacterized protein GlcG (DUF336 family)